jgi:polyketide biosynthesis 3-hydroxy-3-methylglutaryl-CoA synthase-like enzyme PksG
MLVSDTPYIFQVDVGANGYYGFEVMDTCRPSADTEAGNADLSLLSYLECCEQAFLAYQDRVEGADYRVSFGFLAFHTPFGGMVKGAHRTMMRKFGKVAAKEIEADFVRRVVPGLTYCQRLGNIMGATLPLSLVSTIDHAEINQASRIGCFSYGSGCCSEFFSGVATADSQARVRSLGLKSQFDRRYVLSMDEYETILRESRSVKFGTRNARPPAGLIPSAARSASAAPCLYLKEIREFHREYEWVS